MNEVIRLCMLCFFLIIAFHRSGFIDEVVSLTLRNRFRSSVTRRFDSDSSELAEKRTLSRVDEVREMSVLSVFVWVWLQHDHISASKIQLFNVSLHNKQEKEKQEKRMRWQGTNSCVISHIVQRVTFFSAKRHALPPFGSWHIRTHVARVAFARLIALRAARNATRNE